MGSTAPVRLRDRIAKGFAWTLFGGAIGQAAALARSVVPARLLGLEAFGRLVTIQSVLGMVAGFAGLGLGITATRYISHLRQADPARCGRILAMCSLLTLVTGVVSAIVLVAAAPLFSVKYFGDTHSAPDVRLGAIYVLFFTMNTYQVGALSGFEAFSQVAWTGLLQAVVVVISMAGFTYLWGLPGAVIALGVAAAFGWVIQGIVLRRECAANRVPSGWPPTFGEREVLSGFALPAAASGVLGGLVTGLSSALLVRAPNGLIEMGLFGAAMTVRSIVTFVPGLLTRVTMPVLTNLRGGNEERRFRMTFWAGLGTGALLAFLASVVLVLATPLLLRLFGKSFATGKAVVVWLLLSAVLEVIATNLFQLLYSRGRMWSNLGVSGVWSATIIVGAWFLAPRYGAVGLAVSFCIAWALAIVGYAFAARGEILHPPAAVLLDVR